MAGEAARFGLERRSRSATRRERLLLASIVACGLVLRLFRLTQEALWVDEFFTLQTASLDSLGSIVAHLRAAEPHPPLYFLGMHVWLGVAGAGDLALRLPSALIGATAPALLWAWMHLLHLRGRLVAAGLLSLSPMAVWHGQ